MRAPVRPGSQGLDTTGLDDGGRSHGVALVPPDGSPFGALVVQGSWESLLTVSEVATLLRVSISAEELFREALLVFGTRVAGTIRVCDPKGRLAREARFEPRGSASVAEG